MSTISSHLRPYEFAAMPSANDDGTKAIQTGTAAFTPWRKALESITSRYPTAGEISTNDPAAGRKFPRLRFQFAFRRRFLYKAVMKVTRIYTGADGHSHFDEVEVEIGKLQSGDGIVFRHELPGRVQDWHPA